MIWSRDAPLDTTPVFLAFILFYFMSDKLHQINITYSNKEDRLLLRTSTQDGNEYRVWLTRRFTQLLLNILTKEMEQHGGSITVGSKEQTTKMIKDGAFEKKYEENKAVSYPFGVDGMLAFGIKSGSNETGIFVLEIQSESGQCVTFNLDESLTYMLYSLITQGIERAGWQLHSEEKNISSHIH